MGSAPPAVCAWGRRQRGRKKLCVHSSTYLSAAASRFQTTRAIGIFALVLLITALQAHARQVRKRHAVNWTTINIQGGYINRTRIIIIINIVQYHTDHTYQTYTINIRQYTSNHDIITMAFKFARQKNLASLAGF